MSLSRKALIAHADPAVRTVYSEVLDAAGYWTLQASDGQQALRLAASHVPALVIADFALPALGTRHLIRLLRSGERTSRIWIVLLAESEEERLKLLKEAVDFEICVSGTSRSFLPAVLEL